jgi:hypothetical protein
VTAIKEGRPHVGKTGEIPAFHSRSPYDRTGQLESAASVPVRMAPGRHRNDRWRPPDGPDVSVYSQNRGKTADEPSGVKHVAQLCKYRLDGPRCGPTLEWRPRHRQNRRQNG